MRSGREMPFSTRTPRSMHSVESRSDLQRLPWNNSNLLPARYKKKNFGECAKICKLHNKRGWMMFFESKSAHTTPHTS
jgi:hypothetical protein